MRAVPTLSTIDGVPVLVAPADGRPSSGGISFRIGTVDEPPRWRGVSHLVEHLALATLEADSHANGITGPETTSFVRRGAPDEVLGFLRSVCSRLGDLPMEMLEREKSVLRAESARQQGSVVELLDLYRYGSRGYGRVWAPEWGLDQLSAADVQAWARRHFTRENAVVWLVADDLPTSVGLPLPPGPRTPPSASPTVLPHTPAWVPAGQLGVAWSAVVPRGPAASLLAEVLRRDLFRALRTEAGISYHVDVTLRPRSGAVADLIVLADVLPDQLDRALGSTLRSLLRLKNGLLVPADLAGARLEVLTSLRDPDADRELLPHRAVDLLLGDPAPTAAEWARAVEATTDADVVRVARVAFDSGLIVVPEGRNAQHAGFVRAPESTSAAVSGRRFPAASDRREVLTVGDAGVSWTDGAWSLTVRYADTEALLVHPDGGRELIGADGLRLGIEPTLYPRVADVIPQIDAAVPPDARVLVARPSSEVPVPGPRVRHPWSARARFRLLVAGWTLLAVVVAVIVWTAVTHPGTLPRVVAVSPALGVGVMAQLTRDWRRRRRP